MHYLVDPGAPKSLCTSSWLQAAGWTPIKTIQVPAHVHPFRFAGVPIHAIQAVCLVAKLRDTQGKDHILRLVAFLLPSSTPIPFLLGLQALRSKSVDLCLREANHASHAKINAWNSIQNLVVNSHVWLPFTPQNVDPYPSFNWEPLMEKTFLFITSPRSNPTAAVFFIHEQAQAISPPKIEDVQPTVAQAAIAHPWERDSWSSKLSEPNVLQLHKALRHPPGSSMLKLFRQQYAGRKIPQAVQRRIQEVSSSCRECNENAELPRFPKTALPPSASPNVAVELDVMSHTVKKQAHLNLSDDRQG